MSASDRHDTYTLDELTSATRVTVRTVRYYIAEGLLPPSEGAGRAARYSDEHRDRLEVINALKERHLPLREIRRYLHGLSADDIAALASETREEGDMERDEQSALHSPMLDDIGIDMASMQMSATAAPEPGDNPALDYIRSIREEPPHRRPRAMPYVPTRPGDADQQWRRLPISPDAELIVSDDLYRRRREQIESLISWARQIVNEP